MDNEIRLFESEEISCVATREGFVGEGSYGVVRLGFHDVCGTVAMKCTAINGGRGEQQLVESKIRREIGSLQRASHENVVRVYGWAMWTGSIAIVMEYLPAGSLKQILLEHDDVELSWYLRLRFCAEIANGISFIHNIPGRKRLVHGDIKPDNILLSNELHCKIADFGGAGLRSYTGVASTMRSSSNPWKKSEGPEYTKLYAPPELLKYAWGKITTKHDAYSFAMTMHMVLSREPPVATDALIEVCIEGVKNHGQRPDLESIKEQKESLKETDKTQFCIVELLEEEMIRCWNQNPDRRPPMKEVRDRLWGRLLECDLPTIQQHAVDALKSMKVDNPTRDTYPCVCLNKFSPPRFQDVVGNDLIFKREKSEQATLASLHPDWQPDSDKQPEIAPSGSPKSAHLQQEMTSSKKQSEDDEILSNPHESTSPDRRTDTDKQPEIAPPRPPKSAHLQQKMSSSKKQSEDDETQLNIYSNTSPEFLLNTTDKSPHDTRKRPVPMPRQPIHHKETIQGQVLSEQDYPGGRNDKLNEDENGYLDFLVTDRRTDSDKQPEIAPSGPPKSAHLQQEMTSSKKQSEDDEILSNPHESTSPDNHPVKQSGETLSRLPKCPPQAAKPKLYVTQPSNDDIYDETEGYEEPTLPSDNHPVKQSGETSPRTSSFILPEAKPLADDDDGYDKIDPYEEITFPLASRYQLPPPPKKALGKATSVPAENKAFDGKNRLNWSPRDRWTEEDYHLVTLPLRRSASVTEISEKKKGPFKPFQKLFRPAKKKKILKKSKSGFADSPAPERKPPAKGKRPESDAWRRASYFESEDSSPVLPPNHPAERVPRKIQSIQSRLANLQADRAAVREIEELLEVSPASLTGDCEAIVDEVNNIILSGNLMENDSLFALMDWCSDACDNITDRNRALRKLQCCTSVIHKVATSMSKRGLAESVKKILLLQLDIVERIKLVITLDQDFKTEIQCWALLYVACCYKFLDNNQEAVKICKKAINKMVKAFGEASCSRSVVATCYRLIVELSDNSPKTKRIYEEIMDLYPTVDKLKEKAVPLEGVYDIVRD